MENNSTSGTSGTSKKKTAKKVKVDPIAYEVLSKWNTGYFNVNQLASMFMVHTSKIEKIIKDASNL